MAMLAPRDGMLATATSTGSMHVWHPTTGECIWHWQHPPRGFAHALAFSSDDRLLALASVGCVYLFDAGQGRLLTQWQTHEKHHLNTLAFSPDGRILATGSNDRTVTFWGLEGVEGGTPPKCASYDWGLGKVRAVAFAPDGMTVAAVGDNRKVVMWDVG